MKKSASLLISVLASTLVACGGGGSGGGSTSPTQPSGKAPTCTITSLNGADASDNTEYNLLVDQHDNFFGDVLAIDATCTSNDQIKGLTWEIVEEPSRSEVELLRDGYVSGNVSDNKLVFWDAATNFAADGTYVISVTATDVDGNTSSPALLEVEYLAANYLSGEYRRNGVFEDLYLSDTDRPYYIALPVKAQNIYIDAGVEVYSNDCNGDELSGGACEIAAVGNLEINGTESDPVEIFGGILRSAETREATLYVSNAKIVNGSINHNTSTYDQNYFSSVTIKNSHFEDMKGIVLTGESLVEGSTFVNVGHEFTIDGRYAAISVIDADEVTVDGNDFVESGSYAVGIHMDNEVLPESDYFVTGNIYLDSDIDGSLFDGYDATNETHGDNVQYVTTFVAY